MLFIRTLICHTKLAIGTAGVTTTEGHGAAAIARIDGTERKLRQEFLDLHRRLRTLATHAPKLLRLQRSPGMGRSVQQAQATVKLLVGQLDQHMLQVIREPDREASIEFILGTRDLENVIQIFPRALAS